MLDVNKIDDQALSDIMECKELNACSEVSKMSVRNAFDTYLTWNGFIGHTDTFIRVYESLKAAEIKCNADANQAVYDFANIPEGEVHNPQDVPEEKLEKGKRFFFKKESEYFQILENEHPYSHLIEIWNDEELKWDGSGWFGNLPKSTYCVPIEFRIKELGEY